MLVQYRILVQVQIKFTRVGYIRVPGKIVLLCIKQINFKLKEFINLNKNRIKLKLISLLCSTIS